MSPRLPALKPRDVIRALERAGFVQIRMRGSHRVFEHATDPARRTIIADHGGKDLPRGTLRNIIEQAGLTVEQFIALLRAELARHMREPAMIPLSALQKTAEALMAKAAIEIPDDYLGGLRACANTEKGDLSAFVIQAMLENYEAAKEDRRAMCGDTGVPRWYVKYGNDARVEGGPVALEAALRRATAKATQDVPLRPNRVHPLWRTDHNNNVGIGAPEIEYAFHPDGDWVDLTTVHKGGLFGSDYRMLFPGDGLEGIRRFYLDTLIGFGKRGLACQPAIVGVGLGGSKDICVVLGKQAACLRTVGDRNPDPKIAALEMELKDVGNNIGMGAMGFMGSSMVVDCHIEVGYCHTGGMPMSVHMFCLSSRRATARVFADGRAEFRTDPQWFTDYSRRATVEWETPGTRQAAE